MLTSRALLCAQPPLVKKEFDMLKDLTKAVASLRFRGAVGPMRPTQEAKLREMFEELDEDGSGSLDHGEVAKLAERLGRPPMDEETLEKAMAMMDEDGNGTIDFLEFLAWWRLGHDGSNLL